jgi:hypothetical protein
MTVDECGFGYVMNKSAIVVALPKSAIAERRYSWHEMLIIIISFFFIDGWKKTDEQPVLQPGSANCPGGWRETGGPGPPDATSVRRLASLWRDSGYGGLLLCSLV